MPITIKVEHHEQQALSPQAQARWLQIAPKVEELWGAIFQTADKILQVHLKFGFEQFTDKISPSIEDILLSLKVVESLLDTLDNAGALEYTEHRLVMNAKQQIWLIECVGGALKNGDENDYNAAIHKMSNQALI